MSEATYDRCVSGPPSCYPPGPPAWGLECSESLDVFTALTQLTGASGYLPRLPVSLEVLQWTSVGDEICTSALYALLLVKPKPRPDPNMRAYHEFAHVQCVRGGSQPPAFDVHQ